MFSRIQLIGHLGRDPELTYTSRGTAVARFSLAVDRPSRGNQSDRSEEGDGEKTDAKREAQWFSIVVWDALAETCSRSLHKGSRVFVEGRLESRTYTDHQGLQRTVWDVTASTVEFLDRVPRTDRDPERSALRTPPPPAA